MAMRGALALSQTLRMKIEPPVFTRSRFARRYNMMDEDRVKWYNLGASGGGGLARSALVVYDCELQLADFYDRALCDKKFVGGGSYEALRTVGDRMINAHPHTITRAQMRGP